MRIYIVSHKQKMKSNNMTKCELHSENATLCESHIIPKFVYTWMKETGTERLRQEYRLNMPLQDGIKKYMLCNDCELEFSKYEKWFNENVFLPYLKDSTTKVANQFELKYFIVSVLWRIVRLFKDDGNQYKFKNNLDKAELEWRQFLLKQNSLNNFQNHHFILIANDYFMTKKSEIYFSRAVDIDIAENDKLCFVYAKFSRFILIGEIVGFPDNSFENTNIKTELEFSNANQQINLSNILDFLNDRAINIKDYNDLSEKQKSKNDEYFRNKMDDLKSKEYYKIIKKYS